MSEFQFFLPPPSERHRQHAAVLYSLRLNARTIDRHQVTHGSWQPKLNMCHQNCADWVNLNPQDKAIRGWLCMDFSLFGFYRFASHSVIHTMGGNYLDITPTSAHSLFPFLEDTLEEVEYADCVEILQSAHGYTFLDYKV